MAFISTPDGDLKKVFITDAWLLDQFVGSTLWSWGYNYLGALGDLSSNSRSSPVQTYAGGTNWKQVAGGRAHAAAIKTNGSLWTWGNNYSGQLGDNSLGVLTYKNSPVQTVSGGTNWQQVACGQNHTASIKTDGSLWLWGNNLLGQLGDNSVTNRSSPVQTVSGGTNWKQVAGGYGHTAAIKTDGTLWTWGWNYSQIGYGASFDPTGQLGDNSTFSRSSPVQTVSGGTNWQQVACGGKHTAAIKTNGTLWTWGRNSYGQLGDNTTNHKSSPVQTYSGGTNWKQVACGENCTAAIKTNGSLWLWGNNQGILGDNTTIGRSSPVQTVSGGTNWKQVALGGSFAAAIKTDGSLWLWGNNFSGQLGDNTSTTRSSPVQTVTGGTTWKQVACGYYHTAAVKNG